MKIQTKTVVTMFDGKPYKNADLKELTLGEAVSEMLAIAKEKGAMKIYLLAQRFFTQEVVDIDAADLGLVKKVIEDSERYFIALRGQVLTMIDDIKEEKQ